MKTQFPPILAVLATVATAGAQIPRANLWAHYSAENGVNGSATPLPDKTVVTRWNDISGNNRHLTRTNSTAPAVAKDPETCGLTTVYFKNGYVLAEPGDSGFTSALTGDKTIFVVGRANTGSARDYYFDGRPVSGQVGRTALFAGQSACPTDWTTYVGGQGTIGCGKNDPTAFDRFQLHTIVLAAGKQEHYVNGKLKASGTFTSAGSLDGLVVGARHQLNSSHWMDGHVTHLAIYDKALTPAARGVVERILSARTPLGYSEAYGAGCADSTTNVAELAGSSCIASPGTFVLTLSKTTPNSAAALLFGIQKTNLPIFAKARNCSLLAGPPWFLIVAAATDGAGGFRSPSVPIPTGLKGVTFTSQVAVLDVALPDRWSFSNGVELSID